MATYYLQFCLHRSLYHCGSSGMGGQYGTAWVFLGIGIPIWRGGRLYRCGECLGYSEICQGSSPTFYDLGERESTMLLRLLSFALLP